MLAMGGEGVAYEGLAQVILLAAAFLMHLVEFYASERARRRQQKQEEAKPMAISTPVLVDHHLAEKMRQFEPPRPPAAPGRGQWYDEVDLGRYAGGYPHERGSRSRSRFGLSQTAPPRPVLRLSLIPLSVFPVARDTHQQQQQQHLSAPEKSEHGAHDGHSHGDAEALFAKGASASAHIATVLLEAFVLLHSLLIGLTLGLIAPTASRYNPMFLALLFHQFFEGLALGAGLGASCPRDKLKTGIVMCLLFTCITSVGVGLGMATRNSLPTQSVSFLVAQGAVDAAAAGVLMYAGWVHLLDGEITRSPEFLGKSRAWKAAGFAMLWCGAAIMAVLGKWE
jgi:zinc transporter ZupT